MNQNNWETKRMKTVTHLAIYPYIRWFKSLPHFQAQGCFKPCFQQLQNSLGVTKPHLKPPFLYLGWSLVWSKEEGFWLLNGLRDKKQAWNLEGCWGNKENLRIWVLWRQKWRRVEERGFGWGPLGGRDDEIFRVFG